MDRSFDIERLLLLGPKKGPELLGALGISQPTFSRWLKKRGEQIRVFGQRKSTLYGLSRPIANLGDEFPLYQVGEDGEVEEIARLNPVYDRGFVMEGLGKTPIVFSGIPYFLSDHRPQGFLGRLFARANADLRLPARITDWSEDQAWQAMALRGENIAGDLLVGRESFANLLKTHENTDFIPYSERVESFSKMADATDDGTMPGSSAAGEQPKFTTILKTGSAFSHVIVKYSPQLNSARARRWSDLLVCERIALECVTEIGKIATAPTEYVSDGKRAFLVSERFDRVGKLGRRGMISFLALVSEKGISPGQWAESGNELLRRRLVTSDDAQAIRWLDAFGACIANTDRHYGNLSFHLNRENLLRPERAFKLAPVYDMLPMFFAPKEQETDSFPRTFTLPDPTADTADVWKSARSAAKQFWDRVSEDPRISEDFRKEAKRIAI